MTIPRSQRLLGLGPSPRGVSWSNPAGASRLGACRLGGIPVGGRGSGQRASPGPFDRANAAWFQAGRGTRLEPLPTQAAHPSGSALPAASTLPVGGLRVPLPDIAAQPPRNAVAKARRLCEGHNSGPGPSKRLGLFAEAGREASDIATLRIPPPFRGWRRCDPVTTHRLQPPLRDGVPAQEVARFGAEGWPQNATACRHPCTGIKIAAAAGRRLISGQPQIGSKRASRSPGSR
jgi:hypothetical protein